MTPNEWWKEEPYATTIKDPYCLVDHTIYNIEAIIEEIKRRERGETKVRQTVPMINLFTCLNCEAGGKKHQFCSGFNFCPHCGLKINWK